MVEVDSYNNCAGVAAETGDQPDEIEKTSPTLLAPYMIPSKSSEDEDRNPGGFVMVTGARKWHKAPAMQALQPNSIRGGCFESPR